MKLTNIQLGDYVNIAKPHKVTGMRMSDGVLHVQTDKTDTYYSEENYEPVPLTAKVVKSVGLEWDDFGCIYKVKLPGVRFEVYSASGVLRKENKEWTVFIKTNSRKVVLDDVRYVHELQQAVRLAGLKMEVRL